MVLTSLAALTLPTTIKVFLLAGSLGAVLSEGGGDEGRDDPPALLSRMGKDVAHEVDSPALPACAQRFGDRGLDAFMAVGDDQLNAAQTAMGELAQERCLEGLGLRGPDIHAQHLAPAVAIDAAADDDDRHRDDPPVLARSHCWRAAIAVLGGLAEAVPPASSTEL